MSHIKTSPSLDPDAKILTSLGWKESAVTVLLWVPVLDASRGVVVVDGVWDWGKRIEEGDQKLIVPSLIPPAMIPCGLGLDWVGNNGWVGSDEMPLAPHAKAVNLSLTLIVPMVAKNGSVWPLCAMSWISSLRLSVRASGSIETIESWLRVSYDFGSKVPVVVPKAKMLSKRVGVVVVVAVGGADGHHAPTAAVRDRLNIGGWGEMGLLLRGGGGGIYGGLL